MAVYSDLAGTTGDFSIGGKLSTTGGVLLRVVTLTDAATVTLNADTTDIGVLTSLSQTTTFANPTGTPTNGQLLQIRITSSTSRSISFGTAYQAASSLTLPTATTGSNAEDYIGFRYNSTDSKWDLIATTIGISNNTATRVVTLADAATVTPNISTTDIGILTSLSQTTTFANPTGSPVDGQSLIIRVTSTISRRLFWGTNYSAASNGYLPERTTGGGVEDYVQFRYAFADLKWDLVSTTMFPPISRGQAIAMFANYF